MLKPAALIISLDVGGVLIDQRQHRAAFQQLVGAYFAPLLGKTTQDWTEAHRMVANRLAEPQVMRRLGAIDFLSFYRAYHVQWVGGMCELLGLPSPAEEESEALASRTLGWIMRHIQAALPGATEAVQLLHQQGYTLHTASGTCSLELASLLDGMGVRPCFGRCYGADLINTFKNGPAYYARLFEDLGIAPAEALVVDDSADALGWAAQMGARTVLVSTAPSAMPGMSPCIESLAALPAFLQHYNETL